MHHLHEGAHDVEERAEEPEDIVDVVAVIEEALIVLPKPDALHVKRMVCEEVQDQRQVAQRAPKDHSLRSLLMFSQAVANDSQQRDLFAETKHLPSGTHAAFQSKQSSEQVMVVSAFALENRCEGHDAVLNDPTCLVSTCTRVDDGDEFLQSVDCLT